MSADHDSEVQINTYDTSAFLRHISENYDLSEIKVLTNANAGNIVINYNVKMHYFLLDNIKHAAMAWNAAINR